MVQASHGEKGVPPEEHLTDPRYWRYAEVQRILVGGRLETPLGRAWNLDTAASLDFFRQDIDAYPDREYLDRDGFEEDRDRTGFWRSGLGFQLGEHSDLRLRTTLRYAEHREAMSLLYALKESLDPDNIMNPGKIGLPLEGQARGEAPSS